MDLPFEVVFLVLFIGTLSFFAYRIFRYKGFKGAMFGGEIVRTVGEVEGRNQGPMSCLLKVHVLRTFENPEPVIGVEFVAKSFASYQMMPLSLSRAEATKLASLLTDATQR